MLDIDLGFAAGFRHAESPRGGTTGVIALLASRDCWGYSPRPMHDQRSSFTADIIATTRAAMGTSYLGRLIAPDDEATLPQLSRIFLRGLQTPAAPLLWRTFERMVGATSYVAGRTMYFDRAIDRAMDRGMDQVVLVGAGFDSRATRLARDQVSFYELDHPATQAAKLLRLAESGTKRPNVQCAAADLRQDTVIEALAATDFDRQRPAFFLWEGVTMYLEEHEILQSVVALASLAAPGSSLALDATDTPDAARDTMGSHLRRQIVASAGEPFRYAASPQDFSRLLKSAGWHVEDRANATQLFHTYLAQTTLRPPSRPTNYVLTATRAL